VNWEDHDMNFHHHKNLIWQKEHDISSLTLNLAGSIQLTFLYLHYLFPLYIGL
jgi:hypothetical protein